MESEHLRMLRLDLNHQTLHLLFYRRLYTIGGFYWATEMGNYMRGHNCPEMMTLRIGTLNYSSILKSPYEFYSDNNEKEDLINNNFNQIIQQTVGKKQNYKQFKLDEKGQCMVSESGLKVFEVVEHIFKCNFGKIDKHWQQKRYSALYMETAGVKNRLYLCSKDDFLQEWQKYYHRNKKRLVKILLADGKTTEQQFDQEVLNLMFFDLFAFEAIVACLYNKDIIDFHARFNGDDYPSLQFSKLFREHQKQKFTKAYLSDEKKLEQTEKILKCLELDILYVQQANDFLVQSIEKKFKEYRISKVIDPSTLKLSSHCDSVIIIKDRPEFRIRNLIEENNLFRNNLAELNLKSRKVERYEKEDIMRLNVNQKTVIQAIGNLILITPHLSSTQDQNAKNMLELKEMLASVRNTFPTCHILCAGDLNGEFLTFEEERQYQTQNDSKIGKKDGFYVFPLGTITTNKKRTHLQVQRKKIGESIKAIKDYMVSTLPIKEPRVIFLSKNILDSVEVSDRRVAGGLIEPDPPTSISLPTDNHPYDHFLLTGQIQVPLPLIKVFDPLYKLKYIPSELTFREIKMLKEIESEREKYGTSGHEDSGIGETSNITFKNNPQEYNSNM